MLACKEEGQGALAPVSTICQKVRKAASFKVSIEKEAAHPPFNVASTALSRRKSRDSHRRIFNMMKGLFFGYLGISFARFIFLDSSYTVDV